MATPPQTPASQQSPPQPTGPAIRQQFQPPEGAISIARLKRVGVAFGLLVLGYFTIWGAVTGSLRLPERKSPPPRSGR